MKIKITEDQAKALASKLIKQHGVAYATKSLADDYEVVGIDGDTVVFQVAGGAPEEESAEEGKSLDAVAEKAADKAAAKVLKALNAQKTIPAGIGGEEDTGEVKVKRTIPAEAKRWSSSNLKAFKGQDAEYTAYAFGQWLCWSLKSQAGRPQNSKSTEWLANHGILTKAGGGYVVKAQSESVNSAGGDLVPGQFVPELIRLVESYGVFRANARVRPMTGDTLALPRRTGGLTAYFTGEATADSATAITKSSVATTKHMLVAQKLATYTLESVELAEDAAVSIGDFVAQEIALAFANKEDDCGFNGTGTSTYGGIVGVLPFAGSASTVTAVTGNTAFSTLDLVDFHSVTGKLPEYARANAKWYVSAAGYADSMERLGAAAGGVTWEMLANGQTQRKFLGYPVVISQVMNSTLTAQTSTKILAFGDLAMGATFGDRRGMTIQTDGSRHFDTDQIAIKGTERFDIACHTFDSTSAAGPMIVLKTPAS